MSNSKGWRRLFLPVLATVGMLLAGCAYDSEAPVLSGVDKACTMRNIAVQAWDRALELDLPGVTADTPAAAAQKKLDLESKVEVSVKATSLCADPGIAKAIALGGDVDEATLAALRSHTMNILTALSQEGGAAGEPLLSSEWAAVLMAATALGFNLTEMI